MRCSLQVTAKTLLDQLVLSPAMLLLYLTALKMMEGRPDMIVPYVQVGGPWPGVEGARGRGSSCWLFSRWTPARRPFQ